MMKLEQRPWTGWHLHANNAPTRRVPLEWIVRLGKTPHPTPLTCKTSNNIHWLAQPTPTHTWGQR